MARSSSALKWGSESGKYKPPSRAKPASSTPSKSSTGACPRVLKYRMLTAMLLCLATSVERLDPYQRQVRLYLVQRHHCLRGIIH